MAIQAHAYQGNLLGFPVCGNSLEFFIGDGYGDGINGGNLCGLNFSAQQFLQKQLQQQMNQCVYSEGRGIDGVDNKMFSPTISHPQSLPSQIDQQQGREMDQYLLLQNERLRLALEEQRKQQMAELLKRIESKTQMLMTQKDQEIAQAARRTAELQELLARLEKESHAWRRLAEENEAVAVSLNNTLEELRRDRACSTSRPAKESCFEVENRGTSRQEEGGGGTGENRVVEDTAAPCRCCGDRGASVLLLPCRHLCACGPCAAFLDLCPVCHEAKKASLEVLM